MLRHTLTAIAVSLMAAGCFLDKKNNKGSERSASAQIHNEGSSDTGNPEKHAPRNGPETTWYENKSIQSIVNYRNDTLVDTSKFWNEHGNKTLDAFYRLGSLEHVINYHPNGKKMDESDQKSGLPDGIMCKWDLQGQLVSKKFFSIGNIDSIQVFRNGKWVRLKNSDTRLEY